MALGKCCFCINLRTGCLIIGYINLIGSIIMTPLTIVILVALITQSMELQKHYCLVDNEFQIYYEESKRIGAIMAPVITALLIFLIHFLAFTIILLVGLHQNKRGHVKAYLIYGSIFIVLYIILFFANFRTGNIDPGQIVRDLISMLLSIYFLLVIRSYYLKMDDPSNKPAIYNTA